ncbi:hypothetical protein TNCV_4060351 [Trichonephila clavipes]|nr:hypothetical protein TNCV_4060351 [Trichonephila clavipes]
MPWIGYGYGPCQDGMQPPAPMHWTRLTTSSVDTGKLGVKCVPPFRKSTIHLQTSKPSPGFEPKPSASQTSIPDGRQNSP